MHKLWMHISFLDYVVNETQSAWK